jgi:hypothetical protein
MRTPKGFSILLVYTLYLFPPLTTSLRIRTSNGSNGTDRGLTASPTLIYRRRLNTGRSKDNNNNIYPPTSSPRTRVESKTELYPVRNHFSGYSEETVEPKPYFSSTSAPKIPKSLRRNRSRLRSTGVGQVPVQQPQRPQQQQQYQSEAQQASVEYHDVTSPKSLKVKSGRRRKVKRPAKTKPPPVAAKLSNEELGGETGKETNSSASSSGDKNLALEIGSDDGKYALIDKFFEIKPSQAPGLISYAPSDDFASDNQYTLGNVKENDIWLSDGHLLVLKGGDLDASLREHWKPIDNYQRGKRPPLRIALDSNNPPPFPVFVNDTGPPVFLGPLPPFGLPYPPPGAFNESFDPSRFPPPGMIPLYPNGTIPNNFGPFPPFPGGNNTGSPLYPGPPGGGYGQGGYGPPPGAGPFPPFRPGPGGFNGNNTFPPPPFFPFPPPGNRNGSFPPQFLPPPPGFNPNISGGPPPGYPLLPPLVLNPNDNETDDPSIFLPPPYDFDYQDDNSSLVPPGPFAPGLVVPPPRDFYTVYNRTVSKPTYPPSTAYFGKRPQRPNGKKPKFPITNPPDDSEEAYRPILTTPLPYYTEAPYKKRKQRPGKANKDLFGNKYEPEVVDNGQNSVLQQPPLIPQLPQYQSEQISPISQSPLINPNGIPFIPTTIGTTTTKKPSNQFLYVRGQLKSLAELNAEQEVEYEYASTPRPPFDPRGYPSRVVDENEPPTVLQYHKSKPTNVPAKSFYYNTPKYDAIYSTGAPKKQKTTIKQSILNNYNSNQNQRPIIHPSQPPSVLGQDSPLIYINNNNDNNHLTNQGQRLYNSVNNFQDKIAPNYYNHPNLGQQQQPQQGGPQQQQPQIIELQSPKAYPATTSQRQPHLYNHASPPQNLNFPTNSVFRPAFGPSNHNNQQQSQRSKVLFPGEVTQNGPIFTNYQSPPIYQQQQPNRPQVNGYYSPISQYYQPLDQSQVQPPQGNNFYQQQPQPIGPSQNRGGRYFGNQNSVNRPNSEYIYAKTQDQPYYTGAGGSGRGGGGQGRSVGNNVQRQPLTNPYNSQVNQFIPQSQVQPQGPIQQDLYGNYR